MKEIVTEIEINAPPERVWGILTDFPAYGKWNPFLYRVVGEAILGTQVRVYLKALGRETKLKCSIITLEPNRELRWKWHLFLPGLYGGEHSLSIEPLGENLLSLFSKSIDRDSKPGFEAMDQALKARAEQA
jgi:hypothetical protein